MGQSAGNISARGAAGGLFGRLCRTAILAAAIWAASCIVPHQAVVTDVSLAAWHEPAELTLSNTDTVSLRDMSILLRYNHLFSEDTLTVHITVITPDSLRYEEPFLLNIPHKRAPTAFSHHIDIPYRRSIRLDRAGDYRIGITPTRTVQGIEAVGINIE